VGATVGCEKRIWVQQGRGNQTVPGGLIMPGKGKIEVIRVELSLELNWSFKNQVVKVSG